METKIHPSAVVDKKARLGVGVEVAPFAVIGPKAILGDGVKVSSHVVISGRTTIGARTRIWPFASIGTEPQDLKFGGEDAELICGEDNMFREYVNISIGTDGGGGKTVIGSKNLLMVNTHIAHDCIIGDECIIANGVSLAGHVEVGHKAVLGGHSAVHQFSKVGDLAMLAGGSIVVQDVPPYCTVSGNHASSSGLNLTGLRRAGFKREMISEVKAMYKLLYRSNLTVDDAIIQMRETLSDSEPLNAFISFLQNSTRGVCR